MTTPSDPFRSPDPDGTSGQTPPPAGGYGAPPNEPFGAPQYGGQPYATGPVGSPRNGVGTAALVLGILGLIGALFGGLGIVLAIPAIVLGAVGRSRAKKGLATNGGTATAGLVLGVVGTLVAAAIIAFAVFIFSSGDFGSLTECLEAAGNDQARQDQCAREFEDSLQR